MEQTNVTMPTALNYKITNARIRKDIYSKPQNLSALVKVHFDAPKEKGILKYTLELLIKDKSRQTPVELASITVEAEYPVTKIDAEGNMLEYSYAVLLRVGQRAFDTAYGVLLAKSVGSALHGIPIPDMPGDLFIPRGFPGISLN